MFDAPEPPDSSPRHRKIDLRRRGLEDERRTRPPRSALDGNPDEIDAILFSNDCDEVPRSGDAAQRD